MYVISEMAPTQCVTAATLGLPENNLASWMDESQAKVPPPPPPTTKPLKNPEVPILSDYKTVPGPDFWQHFPSCPLPDDSTPLTEVNVDEFRTLFHKVEPHLDTDEIHEFNTVLHNLQFG